MDANHEDAPQLDDWQQNIVQRAGVKFLENRLARERRKAQSINRVESAWLNRLFAPKNFINLALSLSGMRRRGLRNALNIQIRSNQISIPDLPGPFHGYKILQISDPHFGAIPALAEKLVDCLQQVTFDTCVLTGDFRFRSFGSIEAAIGGIKRIAEMVITDAYAVLGNHDAIHMVPEIESMGIRVLLNESVSLNKGGTSVSLIGVDDPAYYRTHNLAKALESRAGDTSIKILLAHSPDLYNEAMQAGIDVYLCGHTHGGQICLPGGKPVMKNYRSPLWTVAGKWQHESMSGYTSVGAGVSVVAARFNCLPEITVHELISHE